MTKGALDPEQYQADFYRIFTKGDSRPVCTIRASSIREVELLRYAFRVNSTKMRRSVWQSKNLPRGKNSSWIATFIAPLYTEICEFYCEEILEEMRNSSPRHEISLDAFPHSSNPYVKFSTLTVCSSCFVKKIELKKCSRCNVVSYCSATCQKAHWTSHRFICSSLINH